MALPAALDRRGRWGAALAALAAGAAAVARDEAPARVERLHPAGEVRHAALRDLDGDGRPDVILVTRDPSRPPGRFLHIHLQRAARATSEARLFPADPDASHPVPPGALFFVTGNHLPGPHGVGFLTRDSLLAPGKEAPVLSFEAFFPGPDAAALYPWPFSRDLDGDGRDDLLVPASGGYALALGREEGGAE